MEETQPSGPKILNDQDLNSLRIEVQRWMNSRRRQKVKKIPPVAVWPSASDLPVEAKTGLASPPRGRSRPRAVVGGTTNRSPRPAAKPVVRRRAMILPRSLAVIAVGVIGVTLAGWSAIYLAGWDGQGIQMIARALPLPAVLAAGQTLRLSDYLAQVRQRRALPGAPAVPAVRDAVVADFARRVAIKQVAADFHLPYAPALRQPADPAILETALASTVATLPAAWEQSRQRAVVAREAVTSGRMTLADAARRFSRHPSAAAGGDLGYWRPADLEPELVAPVLGARAGEVLEPVKTSSGWWVAQVQEFVGERSSPELRVHLNVMVIPPDAAFYDRLSQKIFGLNVKRLVPR